jgi:hypothetical protein
MLTLIKKVNLDSNGPLVRHWIATNVKVSENAKGLAFMSKSPRNEYTAYKGPTPPKGTLNDRIAFILYEQQERNHAFTPEVDTTSMRNRAFFNLHQFAQDNHLKPVGAAYYLTEYQQGFSQEYPPHVNRAVDENGEAAMNPGEAVLHHASIIASAYSDRNSIVKQAGLLDGLIGGLLDLLGLGDLLQIGVDVGLSNIGKAGDPDQSVTPMVNHLEELKQLARSHEMRLAVQHRAELEDGDLLGGLIKAIADLLNSLLGGLGGDLDKALVGDSNVDDPNVDDNVENIAPASSPFDKNSNEMRQTAQHRAELKQADFLEDFLNEIGGLLNGLGAALNNILVGGHNINNIAEDSAPVDENMDETRLAAQQRAELKQAGILEDLLKGLGDLLNSILGGLNGALNGKNANDVVEDSAPLNDNIEEAANKAGYPLARVLEGSASASASLSAAPMASHAAELKRVGLVGDLVGDLLDGVLGDIDLNVGLGVDVDGHDHHNRHDRIQIQSASASASVSASMASHAAELKRVGLVGDLLDGVLGDIDVEIGLVVDVDGHDHHNRHDRVQIQGQAQSVSASVSASMASVPEPSQNV